MQIAVIGINHKSAGLILREEVAKKLNFRFRSPFLYLFPYVLLSTCNRSELYFSGPDLASIHSFLLAFLRSEIKECCELPVEQALYSFFGPECFLHLAKVVSGFDSAIFGETEIQGQVKNAYTAAQEQMALPSELHYLFQRALNMGKKLRHESSSLNRGAHHALEKALVKLIDQRLACSPEKRILLIGASAINQKIARFLKARGLYRVALTNRSEKEGPTSPSRRRWSGSRGRQWTIF